jgi:hypothetical protein
MTLTSPHVRSIERSRTQDCELSELPADVLDIIIAKMVDNRCYKSLSSLACVSKALHQAISEDVWKQVLSGLILKPAEYFRRHSLTVSIGAASSLTAMWSRLTEQDTSWRLRVGRARERLCCICDVRPVGASYFPATKRGVCTQCETTQQCKFDRWKTTQSARELVAQFRGLGSSAIIATG